MVDADERGFLLPAGPDVLAEIFEGEAVVVHLGTGMYYALDGPATILWESLTASRSGADLDDAQARFLTYLVSEQLAVVTHGPGDPDTDGGPPADWPGVSRFTDMADLLLLDPIHDIDLDGSGWPTADPDQVAS